MFLKAFLLCVSTLVILALVRVPSLAAALDSGMTLPEVKTKGYVKGLKAAGVQPFEARGVGYSPAEMKIGGYSCTELRDVGFSFSQAKAAGYSLAAMRGAGYSFKDAKEAGYTLKQMKEAGYTLMQISEPSDAALRRLFSKVGGSLEGALKSEYLEWNSKFLDDADASVVAYIVSFSGVLTDLNLYNNNIRAEGAAAIAEALQGNEVLKTLNLYGNKIGSEGAAAIAEALRGNGPLTNLDLSGNNIGGETDYIKASQVEGESKQVGAMVIYEGREMVVSQGVDSDGDLKLRDTAGVLAIAKALEVNGVLTSIDLRLNFLRDEGKGVIREAVSGREGFNLQM